MEYLHFLLESSLVDLITCFIVPLRMYRPVLLPGVEHSIVAMLPRDARARQKR